MASVATIRAQHLFTGQGWRDNAEVVVCDGAIVAVRDAAHAGRPDVDLAADEVLAPGFIDVQVNGGGGVQLNTTPTLAAIHAIAGAHRRHGTTGLLPTVITDTPEILAALLRVAPEAMRIPGVLGFHLEGPFLAPERHGVHRADLLRPPTDVDISVLQRFAAFGRTLVTLAPECFQTTQLRALAASGLVLAAGHTAATCEEMRRAADAGVTGVTHLFNAMSQIGPRDGGVVGAALDDDRLFVAAIADGHHVADSNLRLALLAKSPSRLLLVSDAMATAASSVTAFSLQGRAISLTDGRLTDADGRLAGAHLTMNAAVQRFTRALRTDDLAAALIAASRTPACFLGLGDRLGLIAPGYRADMVSFRRATLAVTATWIAGSHAGVD